MALIEDDRPKKIPAYSIGQDLSALSVAELEMRISELKAEIARLEEEMCAKGPTRTAAEALFRR